MVYAKRLSLLVLLIWQCSVFAQGFDENRSGSWLEFAGTNKIHEDWSIPIVGILKHKDVLETYDFSFLRTGISYQLAPSLICTGGVAILNSNAYTHDQDVVVTSQFWIYEEVTLKSTVEPYQLSHRWRLENRWITKEQGTTFNNRFRYRLQYSQPIYGKTFIKTSNEIFLNLKGHIFNQNRFYLGIGQELSPSFKVEIGYLKNHFKSSHFDAISMGIGFKLDFTHADVVQIED